MSNYYSVLRVHMSKPSRNLASRAGRPLALAAVAAAALAACGRPNAMGEADSLILIADSALWADMEYATYDALEETLFTTRDEKKFHVTWVAPGADEMNELLLWRQVLVFGTPDDPLVAQAAEAAGRDALSPPELFQTPAVWATGQAVTAAVLEPGRERESWRALLPQVAERLDRDYRAWTLDRMFVSGADSAFAAELQERLGISLRVPNVYQTVFRDGDIALIRNDNPDPSELIRSILVQRVAPRDTVTPMAFAAWRSDIDSTQYNVPQAFELDPRHTRPVAVGGAEGIEVRGTWRDEAAYPAGGLLIGRALRCPDATYFIDAWLYSPNPRRGKWQFVMQIEEILGSFRCAAP
ncbi:MAG: DUF4837 family protein [Gemmatimonadota bacterium]|nr:DUF4837 family protein [Gemmatimonadota bacterium]